MVNGGVECRNVKVSEQWRYDGGDGEDAGDVGEEKERDEERQEENRKSPATHEIQNVRRTV